MFFFFNKKKYKIYFTSKYLAFSIFEISGLKVVKKY